MAESFAYDDVPYDTEANADTHPSSMATLARLAGLIAAPPSSARVLEIGCGNGDNLLAAAAYLPNGRFVGFDLARAAVAAGIEAARASAADNVRLFSADIRDVRAGGVPEEAPGSFDYVVAHGMYSWIPRDVREDLLALMRDALAPHGVAFLSVNALPGWEFRRALRELARDATRSIDDPAAKVGESLRLIDELGRTGKDASGFLGALSAAAREYVEHVERATPPDAPFSRYVFHDLLADVNEPFSVAELSAELARAGLRVVCETPLRPSRGGPSFTDLADDLARGGLPFLQVLVQRDDAPAARAPDPRTVMDLQLWADFAQVSPGAYRTTTGALLRPVGEEGLARAIRHAPGFVPVRDLVSDDDGVRAALGRQLFEGLCEGVFTLVTERPACTMEASDLPRVPAHVRMRAAGAVLRRSAQAVLTNALHRSFVVPWSELAIVGLLDGAHTPAEIAAGARSAASDLPSSITGPLAGSSVRELERFVATVIDRFRRHAFLVEDPSLPPGGGAR